MEKEIQSKEEAIERVVYGNKHDYNKIFSFAEQWVKTQFKQFSSDDLKEAYYLAGNPIPVEPKVFGGVFSSLSKGKLIFHFGFTKSKHKIAHGRDLKTWISLEFKNRQKQNASNKTNLKLEL
jgi:hypothetical protein